MKKVYECYEKAIDVISMCSTPHGLFASGGKRGYDAVWSRDSMISMIGASLVDRPDFKKVFRESIITLASGQSKNGQIPNCVDKWSSRDPHVDYKTIDSTLWFIIGNYVYLNRYNDGSLIKRFNNNIHHAMNWLSCQDPGEIGMLAQLPTSDWQDAFPHKYGFTINTQALYYKALNCLGRLDEAKQLKLLVNENHEDGLWLDNFYAPYRWKNHNKYHELGDWFDSLGNMLAIVFELADDDKSKKILDYVEKKKINRPYPLRTISPPITKKHKNWQDYFLDCEAGTPNHYSNGGIWGYNGGFYILALIRQGNYMKALTELELLAERNLKGNFPEWTNPITKKHNGKLQAWEAGTYILAYESLKCKKVLL